MNMTCEHLQGTICSLASNLATFDVLADGKTCVACKASRYPMTNNKVVKGLAAAACLRTGNKILAYQLLGRKISEKSEAKKIKGVGTVLLKVFASIGIETTEGCACRRHASEMDHKGSKWCLENVPVICEWLKKEAEIRELPFFQAGVELMLKTLIVSYRLFESSAERNRSRSFVVDDTKWSVVVTSAPRKNEYTLGQCIESIIAAGWYAPKVFAEPGTQIPDGVDAVYNQTRKGCYHNWLQSAKWALEATEAEYILCVQDDSLFHPDTRGFVEANCLWPTNDTGIISLYTASHYSQASKTDMRPVGINEVYTQVWWGTCAVVWRREALSQVVYSDDATNWRGISPRKQPDEKHNPELRKQRVEAYFAEREKHSHLINNSDYLAGHLLNKFGWKMFFIDPSPVQHVAKVSTINHGGNGGKRNCGRCADHTVSLEEQVSKTINLLEETDHMGRGRGPAPAGTSVHVTPGASIGSPPRQMFMIRSSYRDPAVAAYRWKVTQSTLLISLAAQRCKDFEIQLICADDDPLQQEKLNTYNRIAPTSVAPKDWYNQPHDGVWRRITRVDDDDMLSVEFCEMIAAQAFDGTECLFNFPIGSLWSEGTTYRWNYPVNQFITIQTNTRLTPYHFAHQYYQKMMPVVVVTQDIHWMWMRHHGVLSGATPGAIPKRFTHGVIKMDSRMFPQDFEAVKKSLASESIAVGIVHGLRAEFGRVDKDVLNIVASDTKDDMTKFAELYGTDKGVAGPDHNHQYTLIYDRLFSHMRNTAQHILEFGIGTGASLRMWADYFPTAQIHGLDIKRRSVPHPRIVTHRFNSVMPLNTHFKFDVVIDDASHLSSHQRIMFDRHSKHVRPGGFYVIEDLHVARLGGPRWVDENPTMLQTCREWVSQPPFGWTCQLFGDQLCILQKSET